MRGPPSRREFLAALAAQVPPGVGFHLAICNEILQGMSFPEMCRAAYRHGYLGLEVAPFTLSDDPAALTRAQRLAFRRILINAGVTYAGCHALLATPKWLHVTTPDNILRRRSWDYCRRLIDLSFDLSPGGGHVLVLDDGKQRATTGGSTVADATGRLRDGLAVLAEEVWKGGNYILLEPQAPQVSDVVNTLDQAAAIVAQVRSLGLQLSFDVHNTAGETERPGDLIRKHSARIRHVHLNEMDGRRPGAGSFDFRTLLRDLRGVANRGWLSVKVSDFTEGGEHIAAEAARYIRQLEATTL